MNVVEQVLIRDTKLYKTKIGPQTRDASAAGNRQDQKKGQGVLDVAGAQASATCFSCCARGKRYRQLISLSCKYMCGLLTLGKSTTSKLHGVPSAEHWNHKLQESGTSSGTCPKTCHRRTCLRSICTATGSEWTLIKDKLQLAVSHGIFIAGAGAA